MSMFKIRPLPAAFLPRSLVPWLVLWGHSGRLYPASGTWGSLAAVPFALGILYYGGWPTLLVFAGLCCLAGLWAIPIYVRAAGQKDPAEIVIDEVVGIALTFLPLTIFKPLPILFGFAVFRLLDATKPGPIGWCDRNVGGAWGVMLDDIIAGILAAFCVYAYQRLI